MSENKHSPEPWRVECEEFDPEIHNANAFPTIHSGEFEICGTEGFYSGDRDKDIENARRLVACVNALQGVPTDHLEQAVKIGITDVSTGNLFSSRLALQKQRDELLAVLDGLAAWHDGNIGSHMDEPHAASVARAAIASVKGDHTKQTTKE